MFLLMVVEWSGLEEKRVGNVFSVSVIARDDICCSSCRFYRFGKGCWKTGLSAGDVWRCWRGCRLRSKTVPGWNARCLKDRSSNL